MGIGLLEQHRSVDKSPMSNAYVTPRGSTTIDKQKSRKANRPETNTFHRYCLRPYSDRCIVSEYIVMPMAAIYPSRKLMSPYVRIHFTISKYPQVIHFPFLLQGTIKFGSFVKIILYMTIFLQ